MEPTTTRPAATMIGVVHRDPDGEERLYRALTALQPELLTLEVSPYAVEYRREHGAALLAKLDVITPAGKSGHGEIQAVRETLRIPFEVRAAERYAGERAVRVELVDDSALSRELLAEVEAELLTPENLRALTERPDFSLRRTVDSFYRRVRRLRDDEPVPPARLGFSAERLALLELRDEQMEATIRRLRTETSAARWVHVGGVFHLLRVRGLRLLWERLADDGVARAFLDELDQ
jgi:hypothetical protein